MHKESDNSWCDPHGDLISPSSSLCGITWWNWKTETD